jgi:hypothetical protein
MAEKWMATSELSKAHLTQVFSGGACNILDDHGVLLRNQERDRINEWLTERKVMFFDPQIHPDTHGVEYDYERHHPVELAARNAAGVNLYEVSPRTFGGITSLEIAADHFRQKEPMVIYFSDGDESQDKLPVHDANGYPVFAPTGIDNDPQARQAHYREFIKNGNNLRKYLVHFARQVPYLTVNLGSLPRRGDIEITPYRMHAADLFRAVTDAASGKRVKVTFVGGPESRDEQGNPIFVAPAEPKTIELQTLLDQYVDEGNELRCAIAQLINVSVLTRVVYTQRSAILALEELLINQGILKNPYE